MREEDAPELARARLIRSWHVITRSAQPTPARKARPELGLQRPQGHDLAISREIRAINGDLAERIAARRKLAGEEAAEGRKGEAHRRLDHGNVENATAAGEIALAQRGKNGERAPQASAHVGELDRERSRGLLRVTGHAFHPEHTRARQKVEIMAGAMRERPFARSRSTRKYRRSLRDCIARKAGPKLEYARAKLLEDHVIASTSCRNARCPAGFFRSMQALLAAIQGEEHRALLANEGRHGTKGSPLPGRRARPPARRGRPR